MILNIDLKAIEWVCVVYLSQDKVGMWEILNEVDQHTENQKTFGLPDRRTAKVFIFRLIYGGSAWSYALDPDYNWISRNPKFWQKIIDKFYEKYYGIKAQHDRWVRETIANNGILVMPTGRFYKFDRYLKNGDLEWPRTQILNYPVQGLAHDLVTIARVSLYRRIASEFGNDVLFLSTVHDSIVLDFDDSKLRQVLIVVDSVFRDIPGNFANLFGVVFNLPISFEASYGPNLHDLTEVSLETLSS